MRDGQTYHPAYSEQRGVLGTLGQLNRERGKEKKEGKKIVDATCRAREELKEVSPESLTGKGKRQEIEKERRPTEENRPILPVSFVDSKPRKIEVPSHLIESFDTGLTDLGETTQEMVEKDLVRQEKEKKMTELMSDKRRRNVGRHVLTKYKQGEGGELIEKKVSVPGRRYGDKYKDVRKGKI